MRSVKGALGNSALGAVLTILIVALGVGIGHAFGVDDTVVVLAIALVGATVAGVAGVKRQTRR